MKFLATSLFLFMGSIASASVSLIDSCELSSSTRAHVLSRLIQIGLDEQFFKAEEIAEFAASSEFYNPYTRYAKAVESLSLRTGFDKASLGASDDEITSLKKYLIANFHENNAREKDAAVAKKETEQILAPKLLRQLKIPGYMNRHTSLELTWRDGRPIFLTRMDETKRGSNRTMAVVLDPFNSRLAKRVTGVPRTAGSGNPKGNIEFFERNGIPYAVDFTQNFFIDLNKNENTAHSIFRTNYRGDFGSSTLSALVKGPGFVKVVSIGNSGKYANQLLASDLLLPRVEPKVLIDNVAMMKRAPQTFYVDDKAYVAYTSNIAIHLYDASTQTLLAPIKSELGAYSESPIAMYSDSGTHYLAFGENTANFKMRIRIVNLKTRKQSTVRGHFTHLQEFGHVMINGIPHLHFFNDDELALLNLQTQKMERLPIAATSSASRFTWDGREFLIWGASGTLHIFDFASRSVISVANILQENAYQILPFTFKGQVFALVAVSDELPYLLRLTSRDEGESQ